MNDNYTNGGYNNENNIPPQQPYNPQQGYSTHESNPYNGSTPYSGNAPYGSNTPYNERVENESYQQYRPQNNQPSYSPQYSQYYATPKKSKKDPGKKIFALLLCVCIVIASIAIGFSISNEGKLPSGSDKPAAGNNDNKNENSFASPNTEDSPISFSEYSGKGPMTAEQVYETVKDINVGVIVYAQNEKIGEGSGIIVGEDENKEYTYIITAAHVISDSGISVQIQFSDEKELDADIVGYDTKTDIGVVRVKATGFKAATFGNSDKLTVGQTVYAIGNPGGTVFYGSFTSGIIGAIDRPIASATSSYDLPCIQHNAAINPGNSGGALVNEYGQVIGLNSSKITSTEYEGMGFSVPSNTMLKIYNELMENGYVTNRPMLGISYYTVSSDYTYSAIAWKNNLPYGSIVIAALTEDSDLAANGVKVGDIITAVDGEALTTTDILLEKIEGSMVGDTITLSVCRLSNSGSISTKFDVKVKLIEDKGQNAVPEQEPTTENPFSSYFDNGFGY